MKKGFTLIELLIVMVVVGVLVTIALPKYNAAMEQSRSLEGILALEKLSAEANAIYVANDNSYPSDIASRLGTDEVATSTNFGAPSVSRGSASQVTISISRLNTSGFSYTLSMVNSNGDAQDATCLGTDCDIISNNLTK